MSNLWRYKVRPIVQKVVIWLVVLGLCWFIVCQHLEIRKLEHKVIVLEAR